MFQNMIISDWGSIASPAARAKIVIGSVVVFVLWSRIK